MTSLLGLGIVIAAASIWGAAYLLKVWHDDRTERRAEGKPDGWPFSRVLAYVAICCTLASNYLVVPTALRLLGIPNFRDIQVALTPFTLTALLVLDVAFVVIALYLRLVRAGKVAG